MPSEPLSLVVGIAFVFVSMLVFVAAFSRLVLIGYGQRRLVIGLVAGLLVLGLAGGFGAAILDSGSEGAGLPLVGLAAMVLSGVVLAVAWALPAGDRAAPPVEPPVEEQERSPTRPSGYQRYQRWSRYVFVAWFLVTAVVWAVGGSYWQAAWAFVAAAFFTFAIVYTRRSERGIQRALAAVPPGAGPVVMLRSLLHGPGGRERVIAGYLSPTAFPPATLVHPRRLVDGPATQDDWQTPLATLLPRAEGVLMFPDATDAVRWELDLIRREGLQERLVVLVPGVNFAARWQAVLIGVRLAPWPEFAGMLRAAGLEPPTAEPRPRTLLGFDGDGRAITVATKVSGLNQVAAEVLRQTASTAN